MHSLIKIFKFGVQTQDSNLLIYLYPNMDVTIIIHPTLWCRLFDCMPTCWTITLHYNQGFATEICQQLRYSIAHRGLVFTALLLIESQQECHTSVFYCILIQNKVLHVVRSDIQLNLGIRTDP